jgi:DNA adenine methylase
MSQIPIPVMRYHGGKWRIAPWVIGHFPVHRVYVEPFGGAAGVLLRKSPAAAEIYNDLDGEIVNVFRVLRDPNLNERLARLCYLTPYSRAEHDLAQEPSTDPLEQARRTLLRSWTSFGSAGATRGRSGMRTYTKPDNRYSAVAPAWRRVPESMPAFLERFANVIIENRPAIDVMHQHDTPETLHYVDPPYLPETRSYDGGRYYRHEMTVADHEELLGALVGLEGMVVLSGYDSDLYNQALTGWQSIRLQTSGSSRFGSTPRTECLWLNPAAQARAPQTSLFGDTA